MKALARRGLVLSAVALAAGCGPATNRAEPALSAEDQALRHKFRGLKGGQLFVDAFGEKECVSITYADGEPHDGKRFFASGTVSAYSNSKYSYSHKWGVPKALRVTWRTSDCVGLNSGLYDGGTILGDYTVQVATRIPEEVLEGERKGIGGFRLKIRIHDDGPLIGWDLSRGFNLQYMAGGDFREAEIYNGEVVRKGWYIHPKTKQKIEADF